MCIKRMLTLALLIVGLIQSAGAVEVAGISIDETAKVGGKELKLNGAGVRTLLLFKVYVGALYLPEKKSSSADVMASSGPRRMKMVFLREVDSDTLGQAFMDGLNANTDKNEKTKFINQTTQVGNIFATYGKLNKGDVVSVDWIPGSGLQFLINEKKAGEPTPDQAFANALFRNWLGEKPVDASLKQKLLGN